MKLRRVIPALIVLGGALVLILGIAGVFSPKTRRPPPESPTEPEADVSLPATATDSGDVPEPGGSKTAAGSTDTEPAGEDAGGRPAVAMKTVFESFSAKGRDWILTAERGRLDPERGIALEKPVLRVKREDAHGELRVEARADKGTFVRHPAQRIAMSGRVRVEVTGRQRVVLRTDSLDIDLDAAVGRTDGAVELSAITREGRQTLFGHGAEIRLKERITRITRDVRLEAHGAEAFLGAPAAKGESPSAGVMEIRCNGPAVADGFKRTVMLESDVVITQGENALGAQRIEVRFGKEITSPERFTATGGVTFKVAGAEGQCKELVRTAADGRVVLKGTPARICEITASKIVLDAASEQIHVPVPGRLKWSQPEADGAPLELEVAWASAMRLDHKRQEAVFRGDVRFSHGGQKVRCRTLTVRFDAKTGGLAECRAEGDVRVLGRMDAFRAPGRDDPRGAAPVSASAGTMSYDPLNEVLVLSGNARIEQEGQVICGEQIEIHRREEVMRVTGAGHLEAEAGGAAGDRLKVAWDGRMRFSQASRRLEFRRGVSVAYAGRTLNADSVDAGMGQGNAFEDLEASGHVVIEEPPADSGVVRILRADRVQAKVAAGNAVEALEASGHVVLEERGVPGVGSRRLSAHHATAEIGAGNRVERFHASGGVVLEQDGARVTGDRLAFDVASDVGTLTGSPVTFRRETHCITGDRVEFSQRRGRIRVTGSKRVEGSFAVAGGDLQDLVP